ncbi:MAG: aspartate-semialdehyde dehydrogenase [Gemmatimonadaceae bacterium]|nr:aspartate-semialdehyde dehydrogenase [Gemmatimonadaceae bacterium]MCU0626346.1 aspartate-semialdehyde dehydrogenase [Gemmatimonadaceae bacterium]
MTAPSPFGGRRVPVAVLGATGTVGQLFIRLLADHPWFTVTTVAASERSAGRRYADAARWHEGEMPGEVADLVVRRCDPAVVRERVVFSALDSAAALDAEPAFARAGAIVLSNAKSYRMADDVPLLIPEVNPDHLGLVDVQRQARGWDGAIVTNPNCSTINIVLALAPLHQAFGLRRLLAVTMQAISGAGHPGVASLDILGTVIPYIGDEEPKVETEPQKLLGTFDGERVVMAPFVTSAHTNRVPVRHGHTACLSMSFDRHPHESEALAALRGWRGAIAELHLPTAPTPPLVVHEAPDRPQPLRDADAGDRMQVHVGRVRPDPLLDLRLVCTGHNVVRGAAGASILNAELMAVRGLLADA